MNYKIGKLAKGRMWVWLLWATVGTLAQTPLLAQHDFHAKQISLDHGLSESTVKSMVRDHRGFWWLGTFDGLNKFDGYRFTVYRHEEGDPHSLSNNTVHALLEDASGYLWVGSESGLNRLDYRTDQFRVYRTDPQNSTGLNNNIVRALLEDSQGILWVGTIGGGLNRLGPDRERFSAFQYNDQDPNSLPDNQIITLMEDRRNRLWVGADNGLAYMSLDQPGRFQRLLHDPQDPNSLADNRIRDLMEDRNGRIWVATMNGLCRFDDPGFTRYTHNPNDPHSISSNAVWSLYEDKAGSFWVGAFGGGLNRLDRGNGQFVHFKHDANIPHSLSSDQVLVISEETGGDLFLGTYGGGLNKINLRGILFDHYRRDPDKPFSLAENQIMSLCEDRDGALWLGTWSSGVQKMNRRTGETIRYVHQPRQLDGLSDNHVRAVYLDQEEVIWVGTWNGGLNRFNRETETFTAIKADPQKDNGLNSNRITTLYEDRSGGFWVGTADGGLNRFNRREETASAFTHNPQNPNSLSHNHVRALLEDRAGVLWVGTRGGLNRMDTESGQFHRYLSNPDDPQSLSSNLVNCLHEDSEGALWLGVMGGGLNRLNPETGQFQIWRMENGLPNESIHGILEDADGVLWLSHNRGLSRFQPQTQQFRNYDPSEGLQGYQFNTGHFQSPTGEMFFCGTNGVNAFFPSNIQDSSHAPTAVLTDFQVFNKSMKPLARDPKSPLPVHINQAENAVLSHDQYVFSLEFAGLTHGEPEHFQYAYKMEGVDKDWVYTNARRRYATYTRLPSGNYLFKVKAANKDRVWQETPTTLNLRVHPPLWRTWWAYACYALLLLGGFWMLIITQAAKTARERNLAAKERLVARRLRQADKLRDEFLLNTSQELQAPLGGMVGLAQSLKDGVAGSLTPEAEKSLSLIVTSGRRLNLLVNDIRDLSQLKTDQLKLRKKAVDLYSLTDVTFTLSQPLLEGKATTLRNEVPRNLGSVQADEDRLLQIMHNLVSNAVRFTDQGWVKVSAEVVDQTVRVIVTDTGTGIREDILRRFSGLFAQSSSNSTEAPHSGLGLSITNHLVQLHGGEMKLDSVYGEGSRFSFTLPFDPTTGVQGTSFQEAEVGKVLEEEVEDGPVPSPPLDDEAEEQATEMVRPSRNGFTILAVDDDALSRHVLNNHLGLAGYKVVEASSGEEALEIMDADPFRIDLILLDIMMPRMSGYEVCERLRQTHSVHQTPIIFLSAKNKISDLVSGFAVGANDYITKPISKDELLARVKTHVALLDIARNLEKRVQERTIQLRERNAQLAKANSQLKDANRILEEVSLTDPLTGLVNRRYLYKYLDKDTALTRRVYRNWLGSGVTELPHNTDLIFMVIDLDHFKQVNDTYGHSAGDSVLIQIKDLMETASREGDILARLGGEEFLIVSRNADRRQASSQADRLRGIVENHDFLIGDRRSIKLTCSVGYACCPFIPSTPDAISWEQILDIADLALYGAKNNGRNCTVGFQSTEQTDPQSIVREMHRDLAACLERGEITCSGSPETPLKW